MTTRDWASLQKEMERIKGENISVIYSIGHVNSTAVGTLERFDPNFVKLAGYPSLGFIQIIEIKYNGEPLYST
jgi:hypothetical protein